MDIKPIHTSCKDCVFAQYDGKTQTGCSLGRIEKFGEDVAAVYDEAGDEFFVINGRACSAFRNKTGEWAAKNADNAAEVVAAENQVRMAVLVYLGEGVSLHMVRFTAETVKHQSLPAKQILFINNQATLKPVELQITLMEVLGNAVTWRLNDVVLRAPDGSRISGESSIDIAANALIGPTVTHYAVFEAGFLVPPTFIEDVNRAINEDLDRFVCLKPFRGLNGLVVQLFMHQCPDVRGFAPVEGQNGEFLSSVIDKLEWVAKESEKPYLVKGVWEVCQCA